MNPTLRRLHEDYWIVKTTENSLWISNHVGELIKIEYEHPTQLAKWLEGIEEQKLDIETNLLDQLEKSRLLIGDFWEMKIKYDCIVFICEFPEPYLDILKNSVSILRNKQFFTITDKLPIAPNSSTLYIYIQPNLNNQELSKIDKWAHQHMVSWMPLGIMEVARFSIGPVIIPNYTPCFECYITRREANGNLDDIDIRLGKKKIKQNQLSNEEFILLLGLVFTRSQSNIEIFIQNQSAIVSSFNRLGTDLVEDEVLFSPRCSQCISKNYPLVEPWTPMPRGLK